MSILERLHAMAENINLDHQVAKEKAALAQAILDLIDGGSFDPEILEQLQAKLAPSSR